MWIKKLTKDKPGILQSSERRKDNKGEKEGTDTEVGENQK
jgi:hypothetical protein